MKTIKLLLVSIIISTTISCTLETTVGEKTYQAPKPPKNKTDKNNIVVDTKSNTNQEIHQSQE